MEMMRGADLRMERKKEKKKRRYRKRCVFAYHLPGIVIIGLGCGGGLVLQ
jgi:hypothetical protein